MRQSSEVGVSRTLLQPVEPRAEPRRGEYEFILGRNKPESRLGPATAMALEDSLSSLGWPVGALYGPEAALAESYCVQVRSIRQAYRILEARGACRPKRGPKGGLIVLHPDMAAVAFGVANHLRWTGATMSEVWAARRVIEPLAARAAAHLGAVGDNLASIFRTFTTPTMAFAIECLEQFAGGVGMSPLENRFELLAAIGKGDAAAAEALMRADVDDRARALDIRQNDDALAFANLDLINRHAPTSAAAAVAGRFAASITSADCLNGDKLGSISDLAETFGANSSVIVEAIRILEDEGVVECVEGRFGGVRLCSPTRASLITRVHAYLAAVGASPADCLQLCHALNLANTVCATRAGTTAIGRVRRDALESSAAEPDILTRWYNLQFTIYDLSANTVMLALTTSFAAYVNRSVLGSASALSEVAADLGLACDAIAQGMLASDSALALAGQHQARALLDRRDGVAGRFIAN